MEVTVNPTVYVVAAAGVVVWLAAMLAIALGYFDPPKK